MAVFRCSILLSPVLVALAAAGNAQVLETPPAADDRVASVGRWDVVSVEWDGRPVDQEFLAMFQVAYHADGSWAVLFKTLEVARGTSTNHPAESPKTFEMTPLGREGIEPSRYSGIYRLDGDTRVLCVVRHGKPRPDEFAAPRRSDRMLVTLRRAKESGVGR